MSDVPVQTSLIEGMDVPMGSERPRRAGNALCGICGEPLTRWPVHVIDVNGKGWRVPVALCRTLECLARAGGSPISLIPVGGIRPW